MKLWNDSTGLWDLLNLWIYESLGALSPSNPRALKPRKPPSREPWNRWIMETPDLRKLQLTRGDPLSLETPKPFDF